MSGECEKCGEHTLECDCEITSLVKLEVKEEFLIQDTLTVKKLIDILQSYPPDMKIMITWESTVNSLKIDNIYEALTGTLYFDADGNFYKEDFSKNPYEKIVNENVR